MLSMGDARATIYDTFGCLTVWRRIYDYLVCDPSVHVSRNAVALRMACRDTCALGNEYDTSHCAPKPAYMVNATMVWPPAMRAELRARSIPHVTAVGVITPRTMPAHRAKQVLSARYFGLLHALLKMGYAECAKELGRTSHFMAWALFKLSSAWDAPVQCPDCDRSLMPTQTWSDDGMLCRATDPHICVYGPTSIIAHMRLVSFPLAMRLSQARRAAPFLRGGDRYHRDMRSGRLLPDPLGGRGRDVKRRRLTYEFAGQ